MVKNGYSEVAHVDPKAYQGFAVVQNTRDEMLSHIKQDRTAAGHGGVFAGSRTEAPLIAYRVLPYGVQSVSALLDLWSQILSGVEINTSQESIAKSRQVSSPAASSS